MESIHTYFREEIDEYGLKVNLLTNSEINDIFNGHKERLITSNPQYVLCKYINIGTDIQEFCYSSYYEIFSSYSDIDDVALYYLARGVYNSDPIFCSGNELKEFINKKIHLLNSDKNARLFRIFGLLYLSADLIDEAKKLFSIAVEKSDFIFANELFRIYEKENDFDTTYNFCTKSLNLGIDLYKFFFDFLYKSKKFDLLAKHYSEILLSGIY